MQYKVQEVPMALLAMAVIDTYVEGTLNLQNLGITQSQLNAGVYPIGAIFNINAFFGVPTANFCTLNAQATFRPKTGIINWSDADGIALRNIVWSSPLAETAAGVFARAVGPVLYDDKFNLGQSRTRPVDSLNPILYYGITTYGQGGFGFGLAGVLLLLVPVIN